MNNQGKKNSKLLPAVTGQTERGWCPAPAFLLVPGCVPSRHLVGQARPVLSPSPYLTTFDPKGAVQQPQNLHCTIT